jgi:hypothetical protein
MASIHRQSQFGSHQFLGSQSSFQPSAIEAKSLGCRKSPLVPTSIIIGSRIKAGYIFIFIFGIRKPHPDRRRLFQELLWSPYGSCTVVIGHELGLE